MTAEGIIQKICGEIMNEYLKYDDEIYFEANDIAMRIAKLEQDLIAEIKKDLIWSKTRLIGEE